MAIDNPWKDGPLDGRLWIDPEDRRRIDRYNSRLSVDDPTIVRYVTQGDRPYVPGAWSGNVWESSVVLLLLNPAVSDTTDGLYADPQCLKRVESVAMGRWDAEYPNAWLHPDVRRHEPWCSRVVCGGLHRFLVDRGVEPEVAWRTLSRRISLLELSPWVSHRWSVGAVVETTRLSVALASEAMRDPDRIVLLGRGGPNWKMAGLVDVDLLPVSLGVRSNQSRITASNFPETWRQIVDLVTK